MKRLFSSIACIVLFCAFTCENEPLEGDFIIFNELSCAEAIDEVQSAKANFNAATEGNYSELCNAYKLALQNRLEACGEDTTTQDIIDSLENCSFTN
jgi:hypothetical protein